MNKIIKMLFLICFIILASTAVQAKINIFPKARYVPNLSFYDDSGKSYRLKDFKSDMLMVVIWSRTCGPCIKDLKHLNEFAKLTKDKGIQIILISPDKEWKSIQERQDFLKRIGAPDLINYVDKKANFRNGMGIFVTPTVLLINKNNEEAGQITGSVDWDDEDVLKYMLKLKNDISKNLNK